MTSYCIKHRVHTVFNLLQMFYNNLLSFPTQHFVETSHEGGPYNLYSIHLYNGIDYSFTIQCMSH